MNLTVYNTSGYCTSFCEEKHKGLPPKPIVKGKVNMEMKPINKVITAAQAKYADKVYKHKGKKYWKGKLSAYQGAARVKSHAFYSISHLRRCIEGLFKTYPGCEVSIIFEDTIGEKE